MCSSDLVAIGAVASGAAGLESLASGIDFLDDLCGDSQDHHEEKRRHGSQILPNFLTDSLMERTFSINGIIRCSLSPSSCADWAMSQTVLTNPAAMARENDRRLLEDLIRQLPTQLASLHACSQH